MLRSPAVDSWSFALGRAKTGAILTLTSLDTQQDPWQTKCRRPLCFSRWLHNLLEYVADSYHTSLGTPWVHTGMMVSARASAAASSCACSCRRVPYAQTWPELTCVSGYTREDQENKTKLRRSVAKIEARRMPCGVGRHGGRSRICEQQPHPMVQATSSRASLSKREQRSQPREELTSAHQAAEVLPPPEPPHLPARLERQAVHDIAIVTACWQPKPLKAVVAA